MKICELINEFAERYCDKYAFGVAGSYIMPVWQNLKSKQIILCTNEGDAGYISTGLARENRKPVLLLTTASPGITNAISGIASAYKDYLPLIVISGAVSESSKGVGGFQEDSIFNRCFDGLALTKNITKKTYYLNNPDNALDVLLDAYRTTMTAPTGCVHIVIPVDIQNADFCGKISFPTFDCISQNEVLPAQLEKAFVNNERIIFACGWGVYLSNAEKEFNEMCNKLCYPALATMKGLYCVDMSASWFVGKTGMGYTKELGEFIKQYNPSHIVGFGASFGSFDFPECFYDDIGNAKIWAIGVKSENYLNSHNINWVKTNDLNAMISHISGLGIKQSCSKYIAYKTCVSEKTQCLLTSKGLMAKSIAILNDIAPRDVLVTADAGNHYLDAVHLFNSKNTNCFWIDAGLAAMGNGICGTIGMAFAKMHSAYISLTGDGCALMNGNSIHVAAENNLPILFIIYNNHSMGRVRVGQMNSQQFVSSSIDGVDFAMWAQALGAKGVQVDGIEDFESSVLEFFENKQTTVIEVITDINEIPMGIKE